MKNTPSKRGRPDQWAGDLTVWLRENAPDNEEQLARLRRNLRDARLRELTPRQRQMVRLRYGEKLSVTDIALRLGVHQSTVSRCLRRARQQLYRRLRFAL